MTVRPVPESSVTLGRDNKVNLATLLILCGASATGAVWAWQIKARQESFEKTQATDRAAYTAALDAQRLAIENAVEDQQDAIKEVRDSVDDLRTEIERSQEQYVSRAELDTLLRVLLPDHPPPAEEEKPK